MVDPNIVKQLRDKTGTGILDCREALEESGGNIEKAIEILRKKGQKIMENRQYKETKEGVIEAYIHSNGKIGVLIKLVCETDFVAKNKEFRELAHDLALQIAAANPQWLKPEDIPTEILAREREIASEGLSKDKPVEIKEKIIQGKLNKFYNQCCLLEQPFIKDDKMTIKELIQEKIAKMGENIQVKEFIRLEL